MSEIDPYLDPERIHKVADLLGEAHKIMYHDLHHEIYADGDGKKIKQLANKVHELAKEYERKTYEVYEIDLPTMQKLKVWEAGKFTDEKEAIRYVQNRNMNMRINPTKVYRYEQV